jgi:molybdopterin-guanine dinucleotide biosynthesis protein A
MGVSKATLPFGPETMLARVARLLGQVADPLVAVAAPDQPLPQLPGVQVVYDRRPGRGPLEGIAAGLECLQGHAAAAYVTGCDVPRLVPDVVRLLARRLESHQIAVPVETDYFHPLAAVYRTGVLPAVRTLLDADRLRPRFLFDIVDTCRVPVDDLRAVDPDLHTLQNLNRPADYLAALQQCGFAPPAVSLRSDSLMYRFHIAVHPAPDAVVVDAPTSIDGCLCRPLRVSPEALAITLPVTFEQAAEDLARLPRMFVEPDGSFVWVAADGRGDWQVDGGLYDRAGRLLYVELKGCCPPDAFDNLLRAWGWPTTALMFQLVQHAVFLAEADFRSWAAGERASGG